MGWFRKKPKELTEVQKKEKEFGKQCECGHYKADHPNSSKRGINSFTQSEYSEEHYYHRILTNQKNPNDDPCLFCDCEKYSKKKK